MSENTLTPAEVERILKRVNKSKRDRNNISGVIVMEVDQPIELCGALLRAWEIITAFSVEVATLTRERDALKGAMLGDDPVEYAETFAKYDAECSCCPDGRKLEFARAYILRLVAECQRLRAVTGAHNIGNGSES